MKAAAADLEFEEAARLRDELRRLEFEDLGVVVDIRSAGTARATAGGRPQPLPQAKKGRRGRR